MKTLLQLFAFLFLSLGIVILLEISRKEFIQGMEGVFLWKPKKKLKTRVLEATGKKKKNWFTNLIQESMIILQLNKKEKLFPITCAVATILSLTGVLLALLLQNYYLVPVLAVGFLMVPFLYVKILGFRMKKLLNEELETTLSIITTSYIRSENIVDAMEENIDYVNAPIHDVFQQFIFEANLINPDIRKLIRKMKKKIDNDTFGEWCDALVACQDDSKLKSTLLPIVKKLSTVRVVSARLDTMLYEPVKEYITMVILVVLNVPLMYFLNKDWFRILVYQKSGKITLAACAGVIFFSLFSVIKITRPIEYKR
ncbi:type II secretion system F family protein [Anaeromicropila populeti]|uniref:Tight adherence protein B n=1 Tax=Anaeromicropila populeti TaxID=37658 RepID=A0A1I6JFF3_9FIRM|nr:hypothetical protein [Anaeromicropila populeti]SFR77706.1 tight adherence protein B [Anaeromicropila populeti]